MEQYLNSANKYYGFQNLIELRYSIPSCGKGDASVFVSGYAAWYLTNILSC